MNDFYLLAKCKDFNALKDSFQKDNYFKLGKAENFNLYEMRLVGNYLKHGQFGNAEKDLISINSKYYNNMIYKNTVLTPLKKAMGLSNVDYVQRFVKTVKEKESPELVYQALETAGFETSEILSVANVVEGYTQKIILGEDISVDNSLAGKFQNVKVNLWKLNDMLGIESISNYTLKDDYNVDEFFNAYSTLQTAVKGIEKYKQYAPQGYTQIGLFMGIYEPIHEILSIERTSASHPDKITKKYIDEYLSRGRFKDAICDLVV